MQKERKESKIIIFKDFEAYFSHELKMKMEIVDAWG